ncbi:MAG: DUF2264 domain-containing protein [Gemmiger sp.]|nr:DUF2264 domain-containing protein [Gemmiger sp.]
MELFQQKLAQNPLQSRQDAVTLLLDLCRPLKPYYSAGKSLLHLGSTCAFYSERDARMEGWARVLWGLGPLFAGDNTRLPAAQQAEIAEWEALYLEGLIHGTDPADPGYWGPIMDFDQKMVETAALDVALSLAPQVLWNPLTEAQRQNVYTWLNQMNEHKLSPNNWCFFRILTNMTFARLGLPVNEERLAQDYAVIEHCYIGQGWYFDGHDGQLDYYIPFAMHFYSLVWSALAPQGDEARRQAYRARSAAFAPQFAQWFADDGAEIPFGRSLTYRFAHSAFFAALALAGGDGLPWGATRHLLLQNLRHWMQQPITGPDGILTIGYQYPNLIMSECYNAHGSPYWAFKAFLFLALPENHPFWQTPEEPLPHAAQVLLPEPRMLLCHDEVAGTDHITMYPVGQHSANHGNCAAKYEKFVYSNRFGFCIPRGNRLDDGAFDCALAASPAGFNFYRMRDEVTAYDFCADYNHTTYTLLPGTTAESWVIPCGGPWHVRVHKITTAQPIDIADGGFALPVDAYAAGGTELPDKRHPSGEVLQSENGICTLQPWGAVGIYATAPCTASMIRPFPNTNLMANLVGIPTITARLEPGTHLLVHSIFGDISPAARERLANAPVIEACGGTLTIHPHGGHPVTINTCGG